MYYVTRAVISFDVTSIPTNANITEAVLEVYAYEVPASSQQGVMVKNGPKSLYKIKEAWREDSTTWNNAPDFADSAFAACTNTQLNSWDSFDVTEDIKAVVETSADNFGYMMQFPTFDYAVAYRSSEYETVAQRPKLTITYETNTGIIPKNNSFISDGNEYDIRIITIQGREIMVGSVTGSNQLKRIERSLPPGVHIVRITSIGKSIVRKVLLFQK